MKISKLFHWLYCILMFLPFFAFVFNLVRFGLSSSVAIVSFEDVVSLIAFPYFGNVSATIQDVYDYLLTGVFGLDGIVEKVMEDCFTYWTITSVCYLIFDVIMYVPLLVHRWLDKGVRE